MNGITERLKTAIADRYVIERELGEGGMATVYLAQDVKHNRKVALKVLRPELAAMIGAERFLQEIEVTANLQHPNILPLHDSGEADGFLFYVMPFVQGDTLRDKIAREKQLGIDEAVEITRSVAAALDYAHRQGVIHRDIKPENVLLHEGQAQVADFGIALAVSQAGGTRLTDTGLSIGTPHYMSPEQAMGDRELDARSDVYSLGAMLYEMLTGDPPYTGSTAQAIVAKVITEKAPPVTATRDTVPPNVAGAVQKSLAKLPADRFPSAAAFAEALRNPAWTPRDLPATRSTPAESGAGRRAPSRAITAAAAVGGLLAAIAAFVAGRATAPVPDLPLTSFIVPTPDSVTSFGRCCSKAMALSPDGRRLVFVGVRPGGGVLYRRELGRLEAEPIPGTAGNTSGPFFSPDGRWVAFWSDGRLRKVSMGGGPPVSIAEVTGGIRGGSWGDNDVIIYGDDETDLLYTVSASGGTPVRLTDSSAAAHRTPDMLPGGDAAVFHIDPRGVGLEESRIGVVDLASGRIDTIGPGTSAQYAAGHLVYTGADGTLLAQPFDPDARRTTGPAVAIMDGVIVRGDGNGEFAVSESGGLVVYPGGGGAEETLRLIGPDGDSTYRLPQGGNFEDPVFSPDARRIALRLSDVGNTQDIWVFDIAQGTVTRLSVEGENEVPVWSPDGRWIAFSSERDSPDDDLYIKRSDGSGVARLAYRVDGGELFASQWLPDGRLVVTVRQGNVLDIGLLTPEDSSVEWLVQSPFADRLGQVSPDGRWLAYTSDRSGDPEVYVQPLRDDGRRVQVSTQGGFAPRWSPDGGTLFYGVTGEIIAATVAPAADEFRISRRASRVSGSIDFNFWSINYDVHPRSGGLLVILQGGQQDITRLVWIQGWRQIVRDMQTGEAR